MPIHRQNISTRIWRCRVADAQTAQQGPLLVLASASPRRADLLRSMGLEFDVVVTDTDESRHHNERADVYVERLALEKAQAAHRPDAVVIGADTCVSLADDIFGKPEHADHAFSMLRSLSGTCHTVFTGVALVYGNRVATAVERTNVYFNELSDDTINWYISTGEAFDKAGSYGMQGYGGVFVERIEGSPSNVIGLPLHCLVALATRVGVDLNRFRVEARSPL